MDLFNFYAEDHLTKRREARLKRKGKTAKIAKIKARQAKGGILKRAGGAIKKAAKKVGGAIKKTVGAVAMAPLLPFKGIMKKELEKRGVNTSKMGMKEVVGNFYNFVISKKAYKGSHYEEININDWMNDESFFTPYNDEESLDNQVGVAVATVVNAVIGFFKKARDKRNAAKAAGMSEQEFRNNVTEEEYNAGKEAEKVVQKLETKEIEDKPVKKLDIKKYAIYGVIALALGLVIYFAVGKKKI